MKLNVFDRILLAILLIAAILVSFILFGMAANILQERVVDDFIHLFYQFNENAWILAGCALALLLICIKLLFAGKRAKKEKEVRPASAMMKQTDIGGTFIALDAVDAMVQKHCRAQSRVRDCHSTLHTMEDGITIGIRLSVLPDTDVITLSQELQRSLKEYIERLTGLCVKEIGILIDNTTAQAAVPARVE